MPSFDDRPGGPLAAPASAGPAALTLDDLFSDAVAAQAAPLLYPMAPAGGNGDAAPLPQDAGDGLVVLEDGLPGSVSILRHGVIRLGDPAGHGISYALEDAASLTSRASMTVTLSWPGRLQAQPPGSDLGAACGIGTGHDCHGHFAYALGAITR